MKAQMVKNTVIVPVGSKGGFAVKQPPVDRESFMKEGVACYQVYLRGLLDLTDNLVAGKVVPPKDVVRHDSTILTWWSLRTLDTAGHVEFDSARESRKEPGSRRFFGNDAPHGC